MVRVSYPQYRYLAVNSRESKKSPAGLLNKGKEKMTENLPVKQGENRNSLGRFKEGVSGNPNGRPKGTITQAVNQAIEEVETTKSKSLLKHLVERAYVSDKVMIALMNKLIPNVKPKDLEEREDVKFIIQHVGRVHNEEEQQCLNEVFKTWKANKDKALKE
jgi:hypothetical protein